MLRVDMWGDHMLQGICSLAQALFCRLGPLFRHTLSCRVRVGAWLLWSAEQRLACARMSCLACVVAVDGLPCTARQMVWHGGGVMRGVASSTVCWQQKYTSMCLDNTSSVCAGLDTCLECEQPWTRARSLSGACWCPAGLSVGLRMARVSCARSCFSVGQLAVQPARRSLMRSRSPGQGGCASRGVGVWWAAVHAGFALG